MLFSTMNTTRVRWFFFFFFFFAGKTEKAFWEFEKIVIGGRFNVFFLLFPQAAFFPLPCSNRLLWTSAILDTCSSPASTPPAVLLNRPHQARHRYLTILQNLACIFCQTFFGLFVVVFFFFFFFFFPETTAVSKKLYTWMFVALEKPLKCQCTTLLLQKIKLMISPQSTPSASQRVPT